VLVEVVHKEEVFNDLKLEKLGLGAEGLHLDRLLVPVGETRVDLVELNLGTCHCFRGEVEQDELVVEASEKELVLTSARDSSLTPESLLKLA
jgi:hypothetical protein